MKPSDIGYLALSNPLGVTLASNLEYHVASITSDGQEEYTQSAPRDGTP